MAQVVEAMSAAHGVGVAHGALRQSVIRVGLDGVVRIVGFRGGEPSADAAALADLADSLGLDSVPGRPDPSGLATWVTGLGPLPEPTPLPHPASGVVVEPARPLAPPKARIASVAALTLVLGAAAGAFLRPVPRLLHVEVQGAETVLVTCAQVGVSATSAGPSVAVAGPAGTCEVRSDGLESSAGVDADAGERYRCDRDSAVLRCHRVP